MKLVGTENAGYRITSSVEFENSVSEIFGVVIAERINKVGMDDFVTWEYMVQSDGPNYFWGHYFNAEKKACKDFRDRVRVLVGFKDSDYAGEIDSMKKKLFHFCDFFCWLADYYTGMENHDQADEFTNKELGVKAVIESLDLVDEYNERRQ